VQRHGGNNHGGDEGENSTHPGGDLEVHDVRVVHSWNMRTLDGE
jgi:hypothetical protein